MKNIDQLIEGFTSNLDTNGKSKKTAINYEKSIKEFNKFIDDNKPDVTNVTDVDSLHVEDYKEYCKKERKNSTSTINNKLSGISMFFNYLIVKKIAIINPTIGIERPLIKEGKPTDSLTPVEVRKILEATMTYKTYKTRKQHTTRDYAMMDVFLKLGLRANELASIKISDLDFNRKVIWLIGKGGNYDWLPLQDELIKSIQEYLKYRDSLNPKPEHKDTLFISGKGTEYTIQALNRKVKMYTDEARIAKHIHTHSLRHTFGTNFYETTRDLLATQRMMRHSDPKTTTIYTGQNDERLRAMANENMYGI